MAAMGAGLRRSLLPLQPADRARFFNEWLRRIAPGMRKLLTMLNAMVKHNRHWDQSLHHT
jgi:hypothetical protein